MAEVESQMMMLMRGMLPSGQSLDKVVSPATFALVSARVEGLGLPIEPLKRFKPWALALTLLGLEWQEAGFDAELGLDKHFFDRALAAGKEVQGLETLEFQISRFDEMSMAEQDRMLAQTLHELETEKASVTTLADAWKAGDAATVEQIVLQELARSPRCISGCWSSATGTGCRRSRRSSAARAAPSSSSAPRIWSAATA